MNRIFKFNSLISVLCTFYIFNTIELFSVEPELIHYTGVSNNYVTCMVENGDFIWVGTAGDGIRRINTLTDEIEIINEANSKLKGNSISCMLRDKLGNIWFGTEKGLNFYDGNDWICYDTTNSELKNNRIHQIALDSTGKLWISYYYLGLTSFDGTLWKNYNFIENIKYNYINSIQTDKSGNIWIIAEIQGLIKFDGTNVTVFDTLKTMISNFRYSKIAFDNNDNLWIKDNDTNLVKFDGINWNVFNTNSVFDEGEFYIYNISFDNQNKLFLPGNGIMIFDGTDWTLINRANSSIPDDCINNILVDSKSNYWLGTCSSGLVKYSNGISTTYDLNLNGLIDNQIKSISIDKNNKKWILTYNGVSVFDGNKWNIFTQYNSNFPDKEFYFGDVCVDDNDNIWVSSQGFGLWMFNDTSIVNMSEKYPEFVGKNVYKLINHKSGFLYVASDKSLSKYDGTNWEIVIDYPTYKYFDIDDTGTIWRGEDNNVSYFNGSEWVKDITKWFHGFDFTVSEIAIDSKGNKWLSTEYGLLKFDGETWTVCKTSKLKYKDEGEYSDRPWKIGIDSKDNIWTVTWGGDLAKFDGTNWTVWDNLVQIGGEPNEVLTLEIDKLDNLWIATTWNGLYVFREGGVKLTSVEDMPMNELEKIIIYPNPAENTIKFSNMANPGDKYIITDLSGKKVQRGIIESDELDITAIKSGFYFIIMTTNTGNYTVKFVKE